MQNNFTWFWESNDWYPWALPNTSDYMYTSYHVNSAYRRDPGTSEPTSFSWFRGCSDNPSFTMENGMVTHCRTFFPGWTCGDTDLTNYSSGNCSASCGRCTYPTFDTDNGAENTHGYGCELYNEMPILCDIAESYDDDDFTASFHCGACGGGSRNTCLPNDFVMAPRPSDGQDDNAFVIALDPAADTISVEFPYHTGDQVHVFNRALVRKGDRTCSSLSQTIYAQNWL